MYIRMHKCVYVYLFCVCRTTYIFLPCAYVIVCAYAQTCVFIYVNTKYFTSSGRSRKKWGGLLFEGSHWLIMNMIVKMVKILTLLSTSLLLLPVMVSFIVSSFLLLLLFSLIACFESIFWLNILADYTKIFLEELNDSFTRSPSAITLCRL